MSSKSNVGGIFSVDMWLAKDDGRGNPPTPLDSVRIPIISSSSSYQEVESVSSGGVCKVEHTLTIVCEENFWGDKRLCGADVVGCVARVELLGRGKILLGWSPNLGYDQPLRLTKFTTQSTGAANERLYRTWVFKSYSTSSLV
ncbi:MAG: hypothetical protein SNH35_06660 [Rikenellaceae bacterium]